MTAEELLEQLQGIKVPDNASWFPLAPGWWIIMAGMTLALVWWLFFCNRNRNNFYDIAQRELLDINSSHCVGPDDTAFIQALSRWLRKISLITFPDQNISALTGKDWLKFLDSIHSTNSFQEGPGKIFGELVYSKQPAVLRQDILNLCEQWLIQVSKIHASTEQKNTQSFPLWKITP